MKRVYLKGLQPDEVIRRLKAGEVVKDEQGSYEKKLIDGIICAIYNDKGYAVNDYLVSDESAYFEEPEEFKLEVGKPYKTKSGEKAFITDFNKYTIKYRGVIVGINEEFFSWQVQGILDGTDHAYDIVAEWSDDDVAKD